MYLLSVRIENLARYIIHASFSQERMQYLDQEEKGESRLYFQRRQVNQGFTGNRIARRYVFAHTNKGEQMVRHYGYYENFEKLSIMSFRPKG